MGTAGLHLLQIALNTEKTQAPGKPHPGTETSMFSQYTGYLHKLLFEASFGLLKYAVRFLFISHFHL